MLINNQDDVVNLFSDLKFMSYFFNALVSMYLVGLFVKNHYLRASAASSVAGLLATTLTAISNAVKANNSDTLSVSAFLAFAIPDEILWGISEFTCVITTWYKLRYMVVAGQSLGTIVGRRRHLWNVRLPLLYLWSLVFFIAVRLAITTTRCYYQTQWNTPIAIAHAVYYAVLTVIDLTLTYHLVLATTARPGSRTRRPKSLHDFMRFTVFGAVSRVLYMNSILLVIAVTYLLPSSLSPDTASATATQVAEALQNFCYALKYNLSVVFAVDLLLSSSLLQKAMTAPPAGAAANPWSQASNTDSGSSDGGQPPPPLAAAGAGAELPFDHWIPATLGDEEMDAVPLQPAPQPPPRRQRTGTFSQSPYDQYRQVSTRSYKTEELAPQSYPSADSDYATSPWMRRSTSTSQATDEVLAPAAEVDERQEEEEEEEEPEEGLRSL